MTRTAATLLAVGVAVAACANATASFPPSTDHPASPDASTTTAPSPTPSAWAADLAQLDRAVRLAHVSPFTIHSEAEWAAKLADVTGRIESASKDGQFALLGELVGLLDTHSGIVAIPGGFHFYGILLYRFSDGWFVVRAVDPTLVGTRAVSVGGIEMAAVEDRLTPLVPHDNPTGLLEGLQWQITLAEALHGSGIVADPAKPAWVLERPDGTRLTVDPPLLDEAAWGRDLATVGWLLGDAPEAVARRDERIWTRVDADRRVMLISVNDYGDMTEASAAMTAAFDRDAVDRLVLDVRYLRGGNGDIKLLEVIAADERINRPGVITALIGRENVSAGTQVAYFLDTEIEALLVGEPTPARADNFLCECVDLTLDNSRYVITLPRYSARNGDARDAVPPDVAMPLSSADFFAGRDPVLEAALKGIAAPSAQP